MKAVHNAKESADASSTASADDTSAPNETDGNASTDHSALTWTNDGAAGTDDPHHSLYFLLKWLNTNANYNQYCDPPRRSTKIDIAKHIADWINSKGVRVTRDAQQVQLKIRWVEESMRNCVDFIHRTRQSGSNGMGMESCYQIIREKIPFYFTLRKKFTARAGIKPKCTSAELFDSDYVHSSSSEEEDVEDETGGDEYSVESDDSMLFRVRSRR